MYYAVRIGRNSDFGLLGLFSVYSLLFLLFCFRLCGRLAFCLFFCFFFGCYVFFLLRCHSCLPLIYIYIVILTYIFMEYNSNLTL